MISLFSPSLHKADSYGVIAHHLIAYLSSIGISVNAMDFATTTSGHAASQGAIYLGWPDNYATFPDVGPGPRIAVTMFESTKIPSTWAPVLNQMDAVIVPSKFCLDLFKRCGVTAPLHMFPLGISEAYQPVQRKPSNVTTFLAFFDRGKRKGGLTALNAFLLAFGADPRYQLVLKMRAGADDVSFHNPNVTMVQQDMSERELYELYCSCDCLIAPNAAEGFGLLPREFAATNGVALATNFGGTKDDIEQWGVPIPCTLGKADWSDIPLLDGLDLGDWAVIDAKKLASQLRMVASNKAFYLAKAGKAARKVRKLYSWQRFSEQVYKVYGHNLRMETRRSGRTDLRVLHCVAA